LVGGAEDSIGIQLLSESNDVKVFQAFAPALSRAIEVSSDYALAKALTFYFLPGFFASRYEPFYIDFVVNFFDPNKFVGYELRDMLTDNVLKLDPKWNNEIIQPRIRKLREQYEEMNNREIQRRVEAYTCRKFFE
jgi:hypothetical protein